MILKYEHWKCLQSQSMTFQFPQSIVLKIDIDNITWSHSYDVIICQNRQWQSVDDYFEVLILLANVWEEAKYDYNYFLASLPSNTHKMSKISKIVFFIYFCLCKHHASGTYINKINRLLFTEICSWKIVEYYFKFW